MSLACTNRAIFRRW